jgi:hypothetical protein
MTMSAVDPKWMAKVARKLTAAINARYGDVTDARIDRICLWAMRSARNIDTAFAAVQMLRDLETVDRAEAAYLFGELFDYRLDRESGTGDPSLARALEEGTEYELIVAAIGDQRLARQAAFLREHGEDELADMVLNEPDAYESLCTGGQMSLIEDKPSSDSPTEPANRSSVPPALAERVLALSATETIKEWVQAWYALCDALRDADASTAVAAIQSVRAVGGISFEQSLVLMDMPIRSLVEDALEADREFCRLERAMDGYAAEYGIDEKDGAARETRPLAWQVLHDRRERRIHGITAMTLRQFGEHRQANLVSMRPEEYYRILDETEVGVTKVTE